MAEVKVGDTVTKKGRRLTGTVVKIRTKGEFPIAVRWSRVMGTLAYYAPEELDVISDVV